MVSQAVGHFQGQNLCFLVVYYASSVPCWAMSGCGDIQMYSEHMMMELLLFACV